MPWRPSVKDEEDKCEVERIGLIDEVSEGSSNWSDDDEYSFSKTIGSKVTEA